jgi:AcrR family transcriptional regulator
MTTKTPRGERRADALSKERIVEAAIAILDADGESALTFRALATRLATGSGAIYWHVADKTALLTAATTDLIDQAMTDGGDAPPRQAIRAIALRVFDLIDDHPWVGAHLAREPWQSAMLRFFESVGGPIQALGVPEAAQFDAATALVNYILGCAGQNAANARLMPPGTDREAALTAVAAQWAQLSPATYPFVRRMAARLADHDDREQFLAGVDLILAGLDAPR